MNIIFLTLAIDNMNSNSLFVDLIREFKKNDHEITVICPNERRMKQKTKIILDEGIQFLKVKTGNITKTNVIEKGISTILIERQFIRAIKKNLYRTRFDLVIYSTPPVTFAKVISYIKRNHNCFSYLMLKDIFPQNAVDLHLMSQKSLIYRFFKYKEKELYAVSDYIGCTSNANIEYVQKHNTKIDINKIELFPNSIEPRPLVKDSNELNLRKKFGIPAEALLLIYGGNIGIPQGVEFIKEILKASNNKNLYYLIIGSGTKFIDLRDFIANNKIDYVRIINNIPSNEYWEYIRQCDIGLIFLDNRFTVPNTPARLTYYMEAGLPILAATDEATDINHIFGQAKCGFWSKSGDLISFFSNVEKLMDTNLRKKMGSNGRSYLEKNYDVSINYQIIKKHFLEWRKNNV